MHGMRSNLTHLLGTTVLMIAQLSGCTQDKTGSDIAIHNKVVVPVTVGQVWRGDMELTVTSIGQTEALRVENVTSPVSGTITTLSVLEGASVKSGEILATILTRESQAAIAGAQALTATATTPREKEEAKRALSLAQSTQTTINVRAQGSGVVSTRSVVEGSLVSEGAQLFTIVDPTSLRFVAEVSVHDLNKVLPGQTAAVEFPGLEGKRFKARVSAISPESDPQTQTVRVRVDFVNNSVESRTCFKSGVSGIVHIIVGTDRDVLLVLRAALLRDDESESYRIVKINSDSLSISVPVQVVSLSDSVAEVAGPGLTPGATVIIEGSYALDDSTRVTVLKQANQ